MCHLSGPLTQHITTVLRASGCTDSSPGIFHTVAPHCLQWCQAALPCLPMTLAQQLTTPSSGMNVHCRAFQRLPVQLSTATTGLKPQWHVFHYDSDCNTALSPGAENQMASPPTLGTVPSSASIVRSTIDTSSSVSPPTDQDCLS